ncbi:MAG: hypothetical protein ACRCXB_03440 [Aeromonadaceae bacterium]
MKEYLKMFDCFPELDCEGSNLMCGNVLVANFVEVDECEYAAHAINSHDELVEMNKELLELVSEMLKSGTFFISAVESDSFDVDFSDWEKRARALVSSIQEKSA